MFSLKNALFLKKRPPKLSRKTRLQLIKGPFAEKTHKKINYWIFAVIIAAVAISMTIFLGYWFKWDWTGFNEHVSPNVQQYQPAKTLWDWLNLLGVLAIPAVVGLGAAWYTAQQGKVSAGENTANQQETALQAYIDKMSELLLTANLRESEEEDEVRNIARIRTLVVLRRLDAQRKATVLQFLSEASLVKGEKPIVVLNRADLSEVELVFTDLSGIDLSTAILREANLSGNDLSGANLSGAVLNGASLIAANLSGANLSGAVLNGASLITANLSGANLSGAYLTLAHLGGANLSGANLKDADLSLVDFDRANLSGADLCGANLFFSNLRGTNGTQEQHYSCT